MSTWSTARSTFGDGSPQTGDRYDNSSSLRQLQSDLAAAAPGSRWTGSAASAYACANSEHRRVVSDLAGLDQRLRAHVDQSAAVVSTGRVNLDAVRKWVTAAAASVPQNAAGERMMLPIVQKGIAELMNIMQTSNGQLNSIGAKIRGLGDEISGAARISVRGGGEKGGWGSTTQLAEVIKGSAEHPDDTYWFQGVGWLNPAQVKEQDAKTFLATCTDSPQ